jgi:type II protein arginine methyltransferase
VQVALSVSGSVASHDTEKAFSASLPAPPVHDGQPMEPHVWWLALHWQYISHLFQSLERLDALEASEYSYRDQIQVALQPLAHNLESSTYAIFERDCAKYEAYQEALRQAFHDISVAQHGQDQVAATQVAVVGAGRGPLVAAALTAADSVGLAVEVTAVEKNTNAVSVLRAREQSPAWAGRVSVVFGDMRSLHCSRRFHVMVRLHSKA